MPDPPDRALAEFSASLAVRLQARARRAAAHALALPVAPPPSPSHLRSLVLESFLSHLGPPEAESFDAETGLERIPGLSTERWLALERLDPEDIGLLAELSDLGLLSCSWFGELLEPLVVLSHECWRSCAWQREALHVLTPAVEDGGVRAVLIAAPCPSLWRLEQCLPAGRLALLYPVGSHDAAARDVQSALDARDEHAPPGPWYIAAHLDGQPVAWAPTTRDALLLAPDPALGLDAMGADAGRPLRDVLTAALPTLSGVHRHGTEIDHGWQTAIGGAQQLLMTAERLTSELGEKEREARDKAMTARTRAIASDTSCDWKQYDAATIELLALMLRRRRLAYQRLTDPARVAAAIAKLPGVLRAADSSSDRYDDRSVTIHTQANPDRAIRLPFDPLQVPVVVHRDDTRAPIELDAATIPYLEATISCPEDAARILLALTSTPPRCVNPRGRAAEHGANTRSATSDNHLASMRSSPSEPFQTRPGRLRKYTADARMPTAETATRSSGNPVSPASHEPSSSQRIRTCGSGRFATRYPQTVPTAAREHPTVHSRQYRRPSPGDRAATLFVMIFAYWAALATVVSIVVLAVPCVIMGLVPWLLAVSVDAVLARRRERPRRLHLSDPLRW